MLKHLQIRDLAVIEAVDLELGPGFTVLTGETGAGKSILVDALALALGERADSQAVRPGASRLEVSARFDVSTAAAARQWLRDNDLDEDEECVLRRVVGADGRSRAWVNGRPVPLQTLRSAGEQLVDICGQQDYQSLRHRGVQRGILDAVGGHGELVASVRAAFVAWQAAESARQQLVAAERDREARRDLLGHQAGELGALNPRAGEYQDLEREHRVIFHSTRIAEGLSMALARAYDDEESSAQAAVAAARRALEQLVAYDPDLETPRRLLGEAEIQIREAADLIRHRLASLEQDPERQAAIEDRLAATQTLARKHRVAADELPALRARLEAELLQLDNYDRALDELQQQAQARHTELEELAADLSERRRKAGRSLAAAVQKNIASLGMAAARFSVRIDPLATGDMGPMGADEVEFLVTANPGQPLAPLSRVASGGELSRLNLAIQVAATATQGAPTLVFDEVDAGVGGAVAEIVGRRLRDLSDGRQVLCITHLPQVATLAHHHATVTKLVREGGTRTSVQMLTAAERVEETARMLGGVRITEQTRAHAREMLTATPGARRRRS